MVEVVGVGSLSTMSRSKYGILFPQLNTVLPCMYQALMTCFAAPLGHELVGKPHKPYIFRIRTGLTLTPTCKPTILTSLVKSYIWAELFSAFSTSIMFLCPCCHGPQGITTLIDMP